MADHQSGATGGVETVFDSTLESVDAAESLALDVAQRSGFSEEDLHKIGMAVREAMVNAVVHGNRYNLKKKVHFSLSSSSNSCPSRSLMKARDLRKRSCPTLCLRRIFSASRGEGCC